MTAHAALTAEAHRDLRIHTERDADLGDAVMSALVVPSEFRRVQDAYPILFRLSAERETFSAVALFGFENGENLFLTDGRWDARYIPLSIDVQPFLIGRAAPDATDKQVHVDLASARIARDGGTGLFDEFGRPTPYLETVAGKLGELDAGFQAAGDFFGALRRYELLEPLSLEITLDDGSANRLVGFHSIDEEKLRALDAGALGDLHDAGHLMPIFMAIAALGRIGDLIARKNRRAAHG